MQGERARPYVVVVTGAYTALMALFTAGGVLSAHDLAAHGKAASARVLDRHHTAKSTRVLVEFTTATGRWVRTWVNGVDERPGTVIRVRYLPGSPEQGVERAGGHAGLWWIAGPATQAVLGGVLTVGFATDRLRVRGRRIVRNRRGRHTRDGGIGPVGDPYA